LNGYVKNNIANAKLHNFEDAWDAKLFGTKWSTKQAPILPGIEISFSKSKSHKSGV
jgi:hypothetical protein